MTSNYEIQYCLSEKEKAKILQNACVRLSVKWNDGVPQTKNFYHCLHCNITFSRSAIRYHMLDNNLSIQYKRSLAMRFLSNPTNQQRIITNEFQMYFVNGQLKRRQTVSTSPNHPFEFTPIQPQDQPPTHVSYHTDRPATNQHDHDVFVQRPVELFLEDEPEEPEIEDLPPNLNSCFSSEGFDTESFEEFARDF